jgi:transposase
MATGEKNRVYAKARRERIRRVLVAMKLTVGCQDCGYAEHADAIQMDHDKPEGGPDVPWSSVAAKSWASFWRYVLDPNIRFLCANCHAIKSADEQRRRPELGLLVNAKAA